MMKRGSKIFLGLFVAIVLIGVALYSMGILQQAFGGTYLSLNQVSFNSNDPSVGGQAWLMTLSQNGAGQSATGTFTATDGNSKSNSFTVKTSLDKNFVLYPVTSTTKGVYTVQYTKTSYNPLSSSWGCNSDVWTNWVKTGGIPYVSDVYCYKFIKDATYGQIQNGNVNFQSTIKLSGIGGTETCTITNYGANSCKTSDGKLQASWVGSLVSGQSVPDLNKQGLDAIYNTNSFSGGWSLGYKNSFDNYFNYDQNGFINCLQSPVNGDYEGCFKTYNSYSDSASSPLSQSIVGLGGIPMTTGNVYNGQVKLNLPVQVQFPVITMRVKADLIGINIPVGKPQIVHALTSIFQTGQQGSIAVVVKNVGDVKASFNVGVSCNNGFNMVGNSQIVSGVNPGSQVVTYIPITANVQSGTLNGACSIIATDINNPSNKDTSSITVTAKAIVICNQGDKRVSGQNIQECQNNQWTTIKKCPDGTLAEQLNNGTYACVNPNNDGNGNNGGSTPPGQCKAWVTFPGFLGGGTIPDLFCLINSWLRPYIIVFSVVFGLIAGLLGYADSSKKFKSKKNKWITILIGILIAFAVGYFFYNFWFLALIGLIFYSLIRRFFK